MKLKNQICPIIIISIIISTNMVVISSSNSLFQDKESIIIDCFCKGYISFNTEDTVNADLIVTDYNNIIHIEIDIQDFETFSETLQGISLEIMYDNYYNIIYNYDFSKPSSGFFMQVLEYSSYTRISIAFEFHEYQIILDSIVRKEDFKITSKYINKITDCYVNSSYPIDSYEDYNEVESRFFSKGGNDFDFNSINKPKSAYSLTEYVIIHQSGDIERIWDITWLCDDIESQTHVDVAFTRYNPSEAQVKSDLQYYTRDTWRYYSLIQKKDIVGYEIICHGGTEWYLAGGKFLYGVYENGTKIWMWKPVGTIFPDEIEELWGYSIQNPYTYFYYPDDAIIFPYNCYGFTPKPTGVDGMKEAWVTAGDAASFVGSTIPILKSLAWDGTNTFWQSLINEDDVETATRNMCDLYYLWNYDTEWKIFGSTSATL